MRKITLHLLALFFASSCVTRLGSPFMQGYIYDPNKTPLEEAQVCLNEKCVLTNEKGYFEFKRKTYLEFISIGGEAPPLVYNLSISKKTYKDTIISFRSLYGGGNVDLEIEYDSIFLKPKVEE